MYYELAKRLSEAGFEGIKIGEKLYYNAPTLERLIKACGDDFEALIKQAGGWVAISSKEHYMLNQKFESVPEPDEAVANLYFALNKK